MDLYLYELWNFDEDAEKYKDDEDEDEIDGEDEIDDEGRGNGWDSYGLSQNKYVHLGVTKIKDVLPLINGFYECSNLISVYPYSEIGKFGNVGHVIREDGTYINKNVVYGVFLPFQNKTLAKEVVYKALVEIDCPIAANAMMGNNVYSHHRMRLYEWDKSSVAFAKKCDKALSGRIEKGMSLTSCQSDDCIYWKDGVCQEDKYHAGVCKGYCDYSTSTDYENEFWGRINDKKGKSWRKRYFGCRLKEKDMIFYTDDDIRPHAIKKAMFCEEHSGYWFDWDEITKIVDDENYYNKMLEYCKGCEDVKTIPIEEDPVEEEE